MCADSESWCWTWLDIRHREIRQSEVRRVKEPGRDSNLSLVVVSWGKLVCPLWCNKDRHTNAEQNELVILAVRTALSLVSVDSHDTVCCVY